MIAMNLRGVDGIWDTIVDGASAAVKAVSSAAQAACSVANNPTVQQAAQVTSLVAGGKTANQITQGQAYANSVCQVVAPQTVAPPPPSAAPQAIAPVFYQQAAVIARVLPASAAGAAAAGKYKAGSVTRYNVSRGVWSVYSPLNGGLYGMGIVSDGRCVSGSCLGDGEVNPPVPVGFVKAGEEIVPPQGVTQGGQEEDKKSLLKNPYFWLAVGGGVVAVGGTSYLLLRRRRKAS